MLDVEQTAKFLADEHLKEDQGINKILWVRAKDEVRLIEVTTSVTDRGELLPFRFTPDPPDVLYPSVIILLSPRDWERLSTHELELPDSFDGELELIYSR